MATRKPAVLDRRTLNRSLLARQSLLARGAGGATSLMDTLVGLQAQATKPPYLALHARLEGFTHEALSSAIESREVVRIALMRSTIHMVSAADCLTLRPLLAPAIERAFHKQSPYGKKLAGLDMKALARVARRHVEKTPCTTAELGVILGERFPGYDVPSLAQAARTYLPLVQLPPRGLWHVGGMPVCTTAERWLGAPLAKKPSLEALVRRYLAAFGPASARDMEAWCGLKDLETELVRMSLVRFADERGRALYDVEEAPFPDAGTEAAPRFLPEYDNALLGHADRTRIVSEPHRRAFASMDARGTAPLLVDGFVAGAWWIERTDGAATLTVQVFERGTARDGIEEEGRRLLSFAVPGTEGRVRLRA